MHLNGVSLIKLVFPLLEVFSEVLEMRRTRSKLLPANGYGD